MKYAAGGLPRKANAVEFIPTAGGTTLSVNVAKEIIVAGGTYAVSWN